MRKYGESKTTRIVMATVRHVISSSGLRKFQADGFLFDGVYIYITTPTEESKIDNIIISLGINILFNDRERRLRWSSG